MHAVTKWRWDRFGRTKSQLDREVREVEVTIEVPFFKTDTFISDLMKWLAQRDVKEKPKINPEGG